METFLYRYINKMCTYQLLFLFNHTRIQPVYTMAACVLIKPKLIDHSLRADEEGPQGDALHGRLTGQLGMCPGRL